MFFDNIVNSVAWPQQASLGPLSGCVCAGEGVTTQGSRFVKYCYVTTTVCLNNKKKIELFEEKLY